MIATLATRTLQLIFAVIVLGLSIHASQWQNIGSVPATTSYSAFAGAFAILVSVIGFAAIWVSAIPSLIMSAVDALASVLLLAGGVAFAVKLRGIDCGTDKKTYHNSYENELVNGGCVEIKGESQPRCAIGADFEVLASRCKAVEADTAFLFLACVTCIAAAALCYMAHRRGGAGKSSAV